MSGQLFALIVGIDRYPKPVKPLKGCVNDALEWKSLLQERVGQECRLELVDLTDAEATRARIIDRFRSHLGRAGLGDTAFFCFSGHGSQELAPPPFDEEEPDGLCETLLAWDSRPAGWDIADKELAVLIAEVADRGAHVVLVLDSCHSGTATRNGEEEALVRRSPARDAPRSLDTYWFYGDETVPKSLNVAGGWRVLPEGRHVLLAACEDYQTAKEVNVGDGLRRGAFSYHLIDSLRRLGSRVSYREAFKEAQIRVNNLIPGQLPQAEGDLNRGLFDGGLAPRAARFQVQLRGGEWQLDAGYVHGLQPGSELAVFPTGTQDLAQLTAKLATVRLTEPGPGTSRVEVTEGHMPDESVSCPAVLTRLPLPPLCVAVEDRGVRSGGLRRALEKSPFLTLASKRRPAGLVVEVEPNICRLRRPDAEGDLTPPLQNLEGRDREVLGALEHIARWETIAALHNPGSSLAEGVEMTLWEWLGPAGIEPELGPLKATGEIRLPYRGEGTDSEPRRFAIELRNRTDQALYYALFALDEGFAVRLVRNGHGRLPAGRMLFLRKQDGIPASVPEQLYAQGVTRRRDLLVMIVSETNADFSLLQQDRLFEPYVHRGAEWRGSGDPGLLDTLMWRVGCREVDEEPRPLIAHRWAVLRQVIVTERPAPLIRLDGRDGCLKPSQGLQLRVPAGLSGFLRLHNAPSAHRRCSGLSAPATSEGVCLRPVSLAGCLGSDPGLSVLELQISDPSVVSPTNPLVIEADLPLRRDEALAVMVCDGRRSRIVAPVSGPDSPGRCLIRSLPYPAPENTLWLELYTWRADRLSAVLPAKR